MVGPEERDVSPHPSQPGLEPASIGGVSRDRFVNRIRAAVAQLAASTPADLPDLDQALVRTAGRPTDRPGLFAARAHATGIHVDRASRAGLEECLVRAVESTARARVCIAVHDAALRSVAERAVGRAHATVVQTQGPTLDAYFDADTGITDVAGAIAESGTLVLSSGLHGRASFLVPRTHIALVRASQIVPDLADLWPVGAKPAALPASLVLVSGPSKTADIEGILVTGVHGPGRVHAIVIDDA